MKNCFNVIGIILLLLLCLFTACNSKKQDPEPVAPEAHRRVEEPFKELYIIDSLMWRQPDSALARLIPYFDTCCRDAMIASPDDATDTTGHIQQRQGRMQQEQRRMQCVSTAEYNRHYANLLLAELLYKNDYAQTNRPALLQAVSYFDSLVRPTPPFKGAGGIKKRPQPNPNLAFLDARAHYINGVGYYENDSIVQACAEYLKTLELMESHFKEKDLIGIKAKFMTYTYNRLGNMFEEQYMIEPTLECYRHSFDYSIISPISSYSVSIALYRIGKNYNMKGDKDSADYYYSQALSNMPDSTNLNYRDIVSSKALLTYQLTHQAEMPLERLKQMAVLAEDDDERLTRFLIIGGIYFEENHYDSALLYLEPVSENKEDRFLQMKVANYLRIIYDSLEDKEKYNECMHYLALHNEIGAENSALVSQLSEIYKTYKIRKQEKEAVAKREVAVKKVLGIVVSMAVMLALAIMVTAKWKSKKLLKEQREESDRVLGETEQQHEEELERRKVEAEKLLEDKEKKHQQEMEYERQIHKMQQAALSGRLKRSNEELRELKDQMELQNSNKTKTDAAPAATFTEEPICRIILEKVKEGKFKSKVDYLEYKTSALSKQQLYDLRVAADQYFDQFTLRLRKTYPKLTNIDIDYCCLYLLGLTDADIAALMQRAYNTVVERDSKIKKVLSNDDPLPITLIGIAKSSLSI